MNRAFLITNDSITVTLDSQTSTLSKSDPMAGRVLTALKKKDWKTVENLMNRPLAISKYMQGKVIVQDGEVYWNGGRVRNLISQRILEFMRDGLDSKPLIKFLTRLMQNPDERCRESLYAFMESNQIPIDENGNIIGYKSLNPKGLVDWFSGSIKHKIGKVVRWGQRENEQPILDAQYGLDCAGVGYHVGTHNYASTFSTPNVLCLVRVDPAKVISVPNEGSMGKIRCSEYTVLGVYKPKSAIKKPLVYHRLLKKVFKRKKPVKKIVKKKTGKRKQVTKKR